MSGKSGVTVVGAGVMGLVLAKELALRGIDVTVLDSKRSVSDGAAKASGIFSKEGLDRIGVERETATLNTLNGAVLHGGGESAAVRARETIAFVLDRGILAKLCGEQAEKAGAKVVLGRRLDRKDVLELASDKNSIVVGADGAVSTVASTLGFPPIGEHVLTYKAEYQNATISDVHMVDLFFSKKVARGLFGWTVPYSGTKLEVGIGIGSGFGKNSTTAFREFSKTQRIIEMTGNAKMVAGYASMIPLGMRKKTVIRNVMLLGDAAGQVKSTTGGGIIFGASCAKIAADTIERHIKSGTSLQMYEKRWRKAYGLDLRIHKLLHGYVSSMGDRSLAVSLKLLKATGMDRFLGTYGDMDRPSLMLKRLFLRRLGG